MQGLIDWFYANHTALARLVVLVIIGVPLIGLAEKIARRLGAKKFSPQGVMLLCKLIRYGLGTVLTVVLLGEMGFNLIAILGAAGIAGVAIGFAAQTSLSNLISGLFLILEKPFHVDDVLQVGETTGLVHEIDLLSVKLRTFDNRFVRIPNESLIKETFINITRFPIRRMDIDIHVAYKEDVDHVVRVLTEIADQNPYALDEPAPLILFKGFGDSALEFLLGVWFEKTDTLTLRNSIMKEIKSRFDREGIEIPFPHRTLCVSANSAPFPVRMVDAT
jgi:small-conductance mechanosensitive channel